MQEKKWRTIELSVDILFLFTNLASLILADEWYWRAIFFGGMLLFGFAIKKGWNKLKVLP